jgi:MFS transporter, CP family, cyanate transporter
MAEKIGDRLPLLIGLALASLTLRPQVVGLGPLIPDIQRSLGMTHAAAGLLITIPVLCMGLFAPVAPVLAGRIGAVRAVTIAVALIGFAGLARLAVGGTAGVLLFTFAIGVGMGLGNALMVVAVKERFSDHPLLLTSVYTAGIQLGSSIAAVLAVPIADAMGGWRFTLGAFSLASIVALLAWVLLSRSAPKSRPPGVFPRFPIKSGIAWVFVAMFALMGVVYYGITAWVPAAYVELGYSHEATGWLAAIFNIGTVPSTILIGIIGTRYTKRRGLAVACSTMVVSTLLLALAPGGAIVWILFAGFANGAMFTLTMSLPLDVADHPVDVGAVAGMMLFIGYLFTAAAPSLLGAVRDATGSFDLVLLVFPCAAALFLACALTLSAARLRRGVRPVPA